MSDHVTDVAEEMQPMQQRQMFMIRLCSDRAAYEAIPKKRVTIDIGSLRRWLEGAGECEVTLYTPTFMVIKRRDGVEVTVVDDGRMIIRNAPNESAASMIAEGVLPDHVIMKS